MKKIVLIFLSIIYFFIVLFLTIYVLNLNKYGVSKINNISFFVKDNNLIIIDKNKKINTNDEIYYYDTFTKEIKIEIDKVTKIEKVNEIETTYTLSNGHLLSSAHLIGNKDATIIPTIGLIISFLSSSLGYLLSIVIPILFILIFFIYRLRKLLHE